MAGPRALTPAEQDIQQVCREEFGLYDPGCDKQMWFVRRLRAFGNSTPSTAEPPRPHPPEPSPVRVPVSDAPTDELMAAFLQQESPDLRRQARRPVQFPPPPAAGPDQDRRRDWGHYLLRWRGSESGGGSLGDDESDRCRPRCSCRYESRRSPRAVHPSGGGYRNPRPDQSAVAMAGAPATRLEDQDAGAPGAGSFVVYPPRSDRFVVSTVPGHHPNVRSSRRYPGWADRSGRPGSPSSRRSSFSRASSRP